jgi:hypothetical protein
VAFAAVSSPEACATPALRSSLFDARWRGPGRHPTTLKETLNKALIQQSLLSEHHWFSYYGIRLQFWARSIHFEAF